MTDTLHEWAYGDWSSEDSELVSEHSTSHDNNSPSAWDLKFRAQELGLKYTETDLNDLKSFESRLDSFYDYKKEEAQSLARQLNCPYTDKDLNIYYIRSFVRQLLGIQRANILATRMGVGPIEFGGVRRQTVAEYLASESKNSTRKSQI